MHNKQNNKEIKTYVQGLRPFVNTLPRSVKNILKKNGYNYSEIINKWNVLVGEKISSCSYPKSIKMNNKQSKGTLVLAVKRGDEINIEFSKKIIIEKINSYFGYNLISEIKLNLINIKKTNKKNKNFVNRFSKNYEKKISEIGNENIKNSLWELLKAIKND